GLRGKVITAHLYKARPHALAGRFDEARREYQAALALEAQANHSAIYCRMAACEFKAGETARAGGVLRQGRAQAPSPPRVSRTLLTEAVRLKLPRPLKARFDQEFDAGLAAPPTGADAAELAALAATLKQARVNYHGQKTHAKKIVGYVDKARAAAAFTEK